MKKLVELFKKLNAYDHFLIFLIILSILKIASVFIADGLTGGLHFMKLGGALFIIASILYFAFKYGLDKQKKYKHVLISTFIILLILAHGDPDPVRGLLVILLLFISKFLIKYKKQNIFNPVVFAVGITSLLALFIPAIGLPPLDWSGIDIRFMIFGAAVPLPLLPITLALYFNVGRLKKHPLAISYIITSLAFGYLANLYGGSYLSYIVSTLFIGAAIIVEPKTSPVKNREQIIYGVAMALFILGLTFVKTPNPTVIGLLIGNVLYFFYKRFKKIL